MTFNGENYLKIAQLMLKIFFRKKLLCVNWCESDSNSTDGPQVLHQNSENSP